MFTQEFMREIESSFAKQMERLGEKEIQIKKVLEECTQEEGEALKCLYASMPVSDGADYPPELYLDYARHGVFLWKYGLFAGQIPENIFAGYVLHHRVNNEDLTMCRSFFYEKLKDKIQGLTMEEAILAINYWCAQEATYRTTDGRTASAACVYRSAYGRCGEESTFAVSVLRSMGIPARQVYVPWWSHCDDNHAWVEVWCEGKWKFLGACEPEEILNKGWFTNASSRAMMVHSRWLLPTLPKEELVGRRGMSLVVNQLKTYGKTTRIEVAVVNGQGQPVVNVPVHFAVMNYACFGEIACVHTGEDGKAYLETGYGTVLITSYKDGDYAEILADVTKEQRYTLRLESGTKSKDEWEDMILLAPKDSPVNRCLQSEEEIQRGRTKFKEATRLRKVKEEKFFDSLMAERAVQRLEEETRKRAVEIMKQARGNQKEIADFLEMDVQGRWKEKRKLDILNSLREKDYLDITSEILAQHCEFAAEYEEKWPESVYVSWILCPRVENEMIRPFRRFINSWFSEEEKQQFRERPELVWKMIQEKLISDERLEYGNLITSAEGALTSGYGSLLTKRVVSVQILRTLGIPSRLNPSDHILEIWKDGTFISLEEKDGQAVRTASIVLEKQEGKVWTYYQNWTISRFGEKGYETLSLCDESGEEIYGEIPLFPGKYKIITANRLPNGNIFARQKIFLLEEGEKKSVFLEQMEAKTEDMLEDNDLTDFSLKREDGTSCRLSELVKEKKGLFIWLEEGKEPTEHILNEIYQRKEAYDNLRGNLFFVVNSPDVKKDSTLSRTVSALKNVNFLVDDFGADMEVLARRMYLEPGKLPLIVIVDEHMKGIYGIAGYNVGTADMILKLMDL